MNEPAIRNELIKWISALEGKQLLHLWRLRRRMVHDDLPPDLSTGQWLHYQVAAPFLEIGSGHLRRLCPSLSDQDLARKAIPPSGGNPTWYIARALTRAQLEKGARRARKTTARPTARAVPSNPITTPLESPQLPS